MSKELCYKVGETGQDNLIAKIYPPAEATGVTLRAMSAETVLPRGTVLAKGDEDELLDELGATGAGTTAAYILCDDTTVGTEDTPAAAYRTGCFNAAALTVAEGYTITAADKDNLRRYGIILHENML